MIVPTLGRIVWFTKAQHDSTPTDKDGRCAAIITYVHSDRMVNLTVFDANGNTSPRTSVPLLQDGDAIPAGGYFAQWMPYQVQVAKEREAKADVAQR